MSPIQICVTGTFSTGKSTLVENIYRAFLRVLPSKTVIMIPEVMTTYYPDERDANETPQTPIKITEKSIELGAEARKKGPAIIIADRGPMSTWCYQSYFQKDKPLTPGQSEAFQAAQEDILMHCDLILFLRPGETKSVDDSYRNTNEIDRHGVDEKHAQMINAMRLKYQDRMPPVIELSFSELCAAKDNVIFNPEEQMLLCCGGKKIPICKKPL